MKTFKETEMKKIKFWNKPLDQLSDIPFALMMIAGLLFYGYKLFK